MIGQNEQTRNILAGRVRGLEQELSAERQAVKREREISDRRARIEAADQVPGSSQHSDAALVPPHDAELDAKFAHLRAVDVFRLPVGYVPWQADEIPDPAA